MDFGQAIRNCLSNYATFTGRAGRAEFWWFFLFNVLASMAASIIWHRLGNLVSLALLLPSVAVGARRLHDIGKSGWFQLLWFVPLIGWIFLIYWAVQKSDPQPNEYGGPPAIDATPALPPGAV
ncbi:DUF805 domain-containing protein [Ramlibacter sp.]|uniref:DUF805 domain-containing protein n=1 Tax=Ramlibacter sp. TaxID=1917967 RepID=UPI002BBBF79F|nr:DUF805 domain-containing protein [Ramlibacter sp.]HWI84279.1 DUF805 domain-containing protein [Ramlibacter sp.]